MHNFLVMPTEALPEKIKSSAAYKASRFSVDGSLVVIDNAHTINTFIGWVGDTDEDYELIQELLKNASCVAYAEFRRLEQDPLSCWFVAGEA
jgi:hypothetical protein